MSNVAIKKYICVKIEWFFFIILYTLIYSTDLKIINNTERCLNQSLVYKSTNL